MMTLAKSFGIQWLASAYGAIVSILLTFLFGRLLGPEVFGNYSYLLTLGSLYAIIQDGGFRTLIFRELTSPTFQQIKVSLVSLSLGHNILVTITGVLILLALPLNDRFLLILAIISFGVVTTSTFFSSQLKGQGQFAEEAQWRVTTRTLGALSVLFFIFIFAPTIELILGGTIVGYGIALSLRPRTCELKVFFQKLDPVVYKSLASLLIIDIATLIYFKIDIVMLRHLGSGLEEVGYYAAGSRLIEGLIFMHLPFATVLFREMRTRASYPKKFTPYILKLFLLGSSSPIIIVPIGWFFSKEILRICYGTDFVDASPLLNLLLISFFIMIPNLVLTQATLAIDQEYFYAKITCVAAVTNICLNLYLIPAMGAKGAAIGTISTEVLLLLLIGSGILSWRRKVILEQ
jgi:O-antigen/teichoic acid export membrane protein